MGRKGKLFVAAALSASLAFASAPIAATAETSDELKAELATVQAQLDELYGQAEEVSENLNDTRVQLDETNGKIDENTALAAQKARELAEAKRTLAGVVAEDYKGGDFSMLAVVLGSRSIEEFVSNVYYVNKVSEQRQQMIATVKTVAAELAETRAALESEKQQQEQLLAQQEQLQVELDSNIEATQSYIDGLSVQIQEALAAEEAARQEEARRQAEAAAAAAAAAEQEAAQRQAAAESASAQQAPSASYDDYGSDYEDDSSSYSSAGGGSYSQISGSAASTIVNAAISQVGCAYVYGACSPGVAFDCSGLVAYAYACAGYSVPHSSAALRAYCNKPASQAVAGDIVWRSGHVGICIGGGATVEALYPGAGVNYGSVGSFLYAGSPA